LTSPLCCVFFFFVWNKWKNPLQRETPLGAMTPGQWVEKSRGHSEPNIISLAYPPPPTKWPVHPFVNAKLWPSAEKPYIINSPLDVEKSTSSVIDHIYYVPAYQGSVSYDRAQGKSFLFLNCLQNWRHFTTQQWPSLVFVFLHYFDKQIKQVHHHPLTHNWFLPTNLFTNSKGSFHRKISYKFHIPLAGCVVILITCKGVLYI